MSFPRQIIFRSSRAYFCVKTSQQKKKKNKYEYMTIYSPQNPEEATMTILSEMVNVSSCMSMKVITGSCNPVT